MYTGAFPFTEAALCNLLFKTSAGAQTVVATVPAAKEAAMWTGTPSVSLIIVFERIFRFADVYLVLSQYRLASVVIKHTPRSAKHLLHVSFNSTNGSRTRLTHQDTSHYVRSQPFRESSQALVSSDRDETADCVRIQISLSWFLHAICAHANQNHLGIAHISSFVISVLSG